MGIIYSGTIKGSGGAKGGAFMHDKKNDWTADEIETRAVGFIEDLASNGDIDPTSNLANNAAIIISGANDPVVPKKNQEAAKQIFDHYGMNDTKLEFIDTGNTGHGMEKHYAHTMVSHLYTSLGYVGNEADLLGAQDEGHSGGYWRKHGTY